jgi:hypothetical protein
MPHYLAGQVEGEKKDGYGREVLCQGAASIAGHAGIGIGSRQRLIGMAGMLQLVNMPEEHAACMTMIAKLLLAVERHLWHRM